MKRLKTAVRLTFLSLMFFSSTLAAQIQMNPLIVNGRPVLAGENYVSHTVAVGDNELFCTGVIISSHHILTAAHCEEGLVGGKVFFGLDAAKFEHRAITAVTAHPDYCRKSDCGTSSSEDDFDILVIEFSGQLPLGFEPVPVASKVDLQAGTKIHLAGYGLNEFGRYEDILKVAEVPFERMNGTTEFRTTENSAGTCQGDSGGPAFILKNDKLMVAGLTSRGDGPCRQVGIYTMVNYFSDWINGITK